MHTPNGAVWPPDGTMVMSEFSSWITIRPTVLGRKGYAFALQEAQGDWAEEEPATCISEDVGANAVRVSSCVDWVGCVGLTMMPGLVDVRLRLVASDGGVVR